MISLLYRCLLALCPASFRNEYGAEMTAVFVREWKDSSSLARPWLLLSAISDVTTSAAGAHADLLAQDLRLALRQASQSPGFALAVILVSSLGIAASTSVFTVADHVLLRALPFAEPDRLVKLWQDHTAKGYPRMDVSAGNYRDWKNQSRSFASLGAYRMMPVNVSGTGEPEHVSGAAVTSEVLSTLGVAPILGRWMAPGENEPNSSSVVVLSHAFWQRHYGGDPSVLGRQLLLDNQTSTIIGVMPPDFHFPRRNVALWASLQFAEDDYRDRGNTFLEVIGRLKPGVSSAQAAQEMKAIGAALAQQFPNENEKSSVALIALRDELSWRTRTLLQVLMGASALLLLLACANLANLHLAKAASRSKEMAVRAALGAARERLLRQMLTESILLAAVGGALGVALAFGFVPLLVRLVPSQLPIAEMPTMDWRVLGLASFVTLVTGIGFGVLPALRMSKEAMNLRSGLGARGEWTRKALVVAQVAAALALTVSCGLLARALTQVQDTEPGFARTGRLLFRTPLPMPKYLDRAPREAFYEQVLRELKAMPGVVDAAAISFRPMGDFRGGIWTLRVPGEQKSSVGLARFVTPSYFSTMQMSLSRGRDFGPQDKPGAPMAAVVSESFVSAHWAGDSGLGKTFRIPFGNLEFTIVGVVRDVKARGIERLTEPQMYFAHSQMPDKAFVWFAPKDFVIRTTGDPLALVAEARRIVRQIDPTQPISDIQTVSELLEAETVGRRTQVAVMLSFALAAMVLAGVGIHGLLAFTVSRRTAELGLRRALGAQGWQLVWMVMRESVELTLLGAAVGGLLAWGLLQAMRAMVEGVTPWDPFVLLGAIGVAVLMSGLGALLPAVRAAQVEPSLALRSE